MKLLLLDLDGTLRRSKSGQVFIDDPQDQELIPGVLEAIARYESWTIIGITNQGGVAAGNKSLETCIEEQQEFLKIFPPMKCIYFCPDFGGEFCYRVEIDRFQNCSRDGGDFRKPGTGMIHVAIGHLQSPATESLFVGDRPEDQNAASRAGVNFIWANTWRGSFL